MHEYFEGVLTNETKCMMCETVRAPDLQLAAPLTPSAQITSKDESFMDLSVDVEPNSSLTACLANFSRIETLSRQNKFWCEQCHSLQEAQKRLRIKSPPRVLVVQLKRFKYLEHVARHSKLNWRVAFPLALKQSGAQYRLGAVIIHLGAGPNQGHYIAVVRTETAHWLLFDDEHVHKMEESQLSSIFGSPYESSSQTGYILFYERHDEHVIDATAFNCAPIVETLADQRPVDIPVLAPGTRARDSKGGLLDSVREDYLRANSPQKNSAENSRAGSLLASKAN